MLGLVTEIPFAARIAAQQGRKHKQFPVKPNGAIYLNPAVNDRANETAS